MKINCVLLTQQTSDRRATTVVCVSLNQSSATVTDLHDAFVQVVFPIDSSRSRRDASTLVLYLAKRVSLAHAAQPAVWLQRSRLPLLDKQLVRDGYVCLDDLERLLSSDDLFGCDFCEQTENASEIHIVAWSTVGEGTDDSDVRSLRKRPRTEYVEQNVGSAVTRPPLLLQRYCVPLDTIPAFEATKRALATGSATPIVLLHGPLFCGKSTILKGIQRWIEEDRQGGQCLMVELKPSFGRSDGDQLVWNALGQSLQAQTNDKAAFVALVAALDEPWYLLVDNLHLVLETQPVVVSRLKDLLCELRGLTHFGGFVGVGSRELQSLVAGDDRLAHTTDLIEVTPFSKPQMAVCFDQMMGEFDASLQQEIMAYSSGSAGVFGLLAASCSASLISGSEWLEWFETTAFAAFVAQNERRFQLVVMEWQAFAGLEWCDLVVALDTDPTVHVPLKPRMRSDVEAVEQHIRRLTQHGTEAVDAANKYSGLDLITRRIRVLALDMLSIHAVAWATVDTDAEDSDHGSPRKRARNEVAHSVVTHPRLVLHKYCVPLNTIPAFEATRRALATGNAKPIVLLYGALFCGKSTILMGVWEWIRKRRGGRCLLMELKPSLGNGESALWKALGQSMRAQVDSKAAFMELVATIDEPWYLLVDNLRFVQDAKPTLVSQFFDVLCELRALPQFGGFVGVGSRDLPSLAAGDDRLAHISDLIGVTAFSKSQMAVCFDQICGSAGVFGSLVEFTAVSYKTDLSGNEWMQWFETMGFAKAHAPLRPRLHIHGDVEQLEQEMRRLRETEAADPTTDCWGLDRITRRIRDLYLAIIAESWRRKQAAPSAGAVSTTAGQGCEGD